MADTSPLAFERLTLLSAEPGPLPSLTGRPDWHESAACRPPCTVNFFPDVTAGAAVDRAKALCRRCDVRDECLAFAIEHREWDGIWGGLTPDERRVRAGRPRRYRSVEERVARARAIIGRKAV